MEEKKTVCQIIDLTSEGDRTLLLDNLICQKNLNKEDVIKKKRQKMKQIYSQQLVT